VIVCHRIENLASPSPRRPAGVQWGMI
jgi:hypothetical protein